MKKKILLLLICIALLGGGILYGLPYGRIYQIFSALQERDGERLSRYVDFASLRLGVKEQVRGAASPERSDPADKVRQALKARAMEYAVDQMITPDGLISFVVRNVPGLAGGSGNPMDRGASPGTYHTLRVFAGFLWQAHGAYTSSSEFVVTFKGVQNQAVNFVLRRAGLDWRMSRVNWSLPAGGGPN